MNDPRGVFDRGSNTSMGNLRPDIYSDAQNYMTNGNAGFDHVVYDERRAKKALLIGLVLRTAVSLSGAPGGAKSRLARHALDGVADASPEDMAIIPPDAELQPIQVVGGVVETSKVIENGDETTRTERVMNRVAGIVRSTHKGIWIDELPRISPWAVNSLLGAPEERELKTTAGIVPMEDLLITVSTNNVAETRQASFKVSTAFATRNMLGVIMGGDLSENNAINLAQGIKPNPNNMEHFTETAQLQRFREAIEQSRLPEDVAKYTYQVVKAAKAFMVENHNIREENRMFEQVGKVARALALFKGQVATNEDVGEALNFVLGSRFGLLVPSMEVNATAELDTAVKEIRNQVG